MSREDERKVWQAAMRGVKPLPGSATIPLPDAVPRPLPLPLPLSLPKARPSKPLAKPETPGEIGGPRAGFDPDSERRLKTGQLKVEARLDLHGMTEPAAHKAVLAFVAQSLAARRRLVLVITGKGAFSPNGEGILKRNLRLWVDAAPLELRQRILATRSAMPRHGGDGAYYLLLKRDRANMRP